MNIVYKVWATPVEMFVGDPELVDNPDYFHGFVPAWSKTDNYKVRRGKPFIPPVIKVNKFHDTDANGVWDEGEVAIAGWAVDVTDPLFVTNPYFTPAEIQAMPEGLWTLTEETPAGWLQTALYIDEVSQPVTDTAQVEVIGLSGEIHEVIFGNIQVGSITACKFNDKDANGVNDDEPPVAGIIFELDGINVRGDEVHLTQTTGEDGCVTFADLLPGEYTLCEVLPADDWMPTTEPCVGVTLLEGDEVTYSFGNIQLGSITACKFDDQNANGINDSEPPIEGLLFELDGINVRGDVVHLRQVTGEDGCVTFADLLPGNYTLCEVLPLGNWLPTTDVCVSVALPEGGELSYSFGNIELGSISACKFDDQNANGINDGEPPVPGIVFTLDGTNVRGDEVHLTQVTGADGCVTFADLLPGNYTLCEVLPADNWMPTTEPCVIISLPEGGELSYTFGNIRLGSISACKFYDRNASGINDGEPPVAGFLFKLDGINVRGDEVHLTQITGEDGCVTFADLLPGDYTLCEVLPPGGWVATTDLCVSVVLPEGGELSYSFGNMCEGQADFGTKGYWHNKNGLTETDMSDFAYLNSLLPWQAPSSYFDAGDEPIDGYFDDGSPVPEAKNIAGELIAFEGTPWTEQSYFLVDRNAGGDPREQLAQQLDAFIMNTRHRLDGDAAIQLPGGQWVVASDLVTQAIAIWAGGTASEQTAMSGLLDALNNSDAVPFVHYNPCPVIYP